MIKFRDLKADEIDVRVGSVKQDGVQLLLYKDARVDMNILDETVGAENWQREHYDCKGNLFCKVGILTENGWIFKSDCGSESNTEAEKGEASDSFKRACVNWGIGRELYSAPFIWVPATMCNIIEKKKCYDNFKVTKIEIKDKQIIGLQIYNSKKKTTVFDNFKNQTAVKSQPKCQEFKCANCGNPFIEMSVDGKVYTPEMQYASAVQHRGGAFCKKCYEVMKNER